MKKIFIALFAFSLMGLVTSISLTQLHFKVSDRGFEEKSFCNISEFVDCDTVIVSRYSHLGPIPTSELGVIYYSLVFLGLLYAWFQRDRRPTLAFLFASMILACVYSVVMAYLSFFELGVLCLLCFTSYIANFFMLFLFSKALELRYSEVPHFLRRYIGSLFGKGEIKPRIVFHVGVTVVVTVLGLLFFRGLSPRIHKAHAEVPREAYLKSFYNLPQKEIDLANRPFWGAKEAKVTVVEFSDFQCPFCRRAAFSLKPYLKEYRDGLRFVFFNYPLDPSCNPAIQHSLHQVACLAAKSALCASRNGKFWEYHDKVFENQKRLSRATLLNLAKEVGLEPAPFEQCLASDEITEELKKEIEEGNKIEVRGTPSVFINGRLFRDWLSPERLRMVIESELVR